MNWRVKLLDNIRGINQHPYYGEYIENQYSYTAQDIESYYENRLNALFSFHYRNNPQYVSWLKTQNVSIDNLIEFSRIPIIRKKDLKEFNPVVPEQVFKLSHSGGTTGVPFEYPLTRECVSALWPNLWRAFDVCGVKPCERILMIAGPSLFNKRTYKRRLFDCINQFVVVSAFDLDDCMLRKAYDMMVSQNIKAIYGYTSSILIFLRFLKKYKLKLQLKGIFSTSETFIPQIRNLALEYGSCDVIDIYGANDGGICAFECKEHQGYHISFERTYLEIIDNKIVLSDLYNTAYPFIRYEVGDMTSSAEVIKEKCKCGRSLFRIRNISGRINSFIEDLDGKRIHTEFFSHLFHDDPSIIQYQILEKNGKLSVNIVSEEKNADYYENKYRVLLQSKFKKEISILINNPIYTLPNKKTPLYYNWE